MATYLKPKFCKGSASFFACKLHWMLQTLRKRDGGSFIFIKVVAWRRLWVDASKKWSAKKWSEDERKLTLKIPTFSFSFHNSSRKICYLSLGGWWGWRWWWQYGNVIIVNFQLSDAFLEKLIMILWWKWWYAYYLLKNTKISLCAL